MNNQKRIIGWCDIKTEEEKRMMRKSLSVYISNSFLNFFGVRFKVYPEDINDTRKEK